MAEGFTLFLLSGMLMCGLLLHTMSQHGADVDKPSKKPNFIIILADDIGWGDLDANQPEEKANNTPYLNLINCPCRERGQPYLLYMALAHMHVPLAPPLPPEVSAASRHPDDSKVYTASLREMDSLVGAFLFHPNSGAAGTFGDLQTVRTGKHKAFYITGSAEACGGATGRQQLHDPPLIFDLERDEAEVTPLDIETPEYQTVVEKITRRREALLWDIATDKSVSTADYRTDASAAPCCDPRQPVCRCHTQH